MGVLITISINREILQIKLYIHKHRLENTKLLHLWIVAPIFFKKLNI